MAQQDLADIERPGIPERGEIPESRQRLARALGALLASILRLVDKTWRRDKAAVARFDALVGATTRPTIAVFWHGRYVPLFALLAGRRGTAFASKSFRGSVVAEICRRFGYEAVLLPARGGQLSRRLIREAIVETGIGGLAVDGPLGPYHTVKPGAIELASQLGAQIVPVSVASRRRVVTSRWDRMEVPLPFTTLYPAVGDPIDVPPGVDSDQIAAFKEIIRQRLEALDARAEEAAVAAGAKRP